MQLSIEQMRAYDTFCVWWQMNKGRARVFYLAGYAGTGKTTIAQKLAKDVADGQIRYAAFTGKAAAVLRDKGCEPASTLHSLIYRREEKNDGTVEWKLNTDALNDVALLVVDECSMVGQQLGQDIMSLETPVLVLGDPFQLPPIGGHGFFTAGEPTFLLTEVHRQAQESAVLRFATAVREGRYKNQQGSWDGLTIAPKRLFNDEQIAAADCVICGRNNTRHDLNRRLREIKFNRPFASIAALEAGDTLIALRNSQKFYNGQIIEVVRTSKIRKHAKAGSLQQVVIDTDLNGQRVNTKAPLRMLGQTSDEFERRVMSEFELNADYGYALTCHKAQGSQWRDVVVIDESSVFQDQAARWLYTAATRASHSLTVLQ